MSKYRRNEIAPYSMEEIEGSRSYHYPGTEFLRLHVSTAGERLAGNAGRKTEVVFDTRTGSGLSTECARIENDDRETLRCSIDRGREPGGSRAHDCDVIGPVAFVDRDHAECARQFGLVRVFQDGPRRAHRQRQ